MQEASTTDPILYPSQALASSNDAMTLTYGRSTLDTWDTCGGNIVALNPSSNTSPSREWETVDSIVNTPVLTDDEGDEFADSLPTLYESLEASVWSKYGVTSM